MGSYACSSRKPFNFNQLWPRKGLSLKVLFIRTKIISHYYRLQADAFEYFQKPELLIEVTDVDDNSFMLSCYKTENDKASELFFVKCHDIISHFLLAINIATLGHFTWDFRFVSPAPYLFVDKPNKISHFVFGEFKQGTTNEQRPEMTKNLIWRTLQIFLALGREHERSIKKEYIKGLYNLHHGFFDVEFLNEAFGSFYKTFEYFCTTRILKVNKLTNEKKQLRNVLSDFGFDETVLKDFDRLYKIRCNQAMHAQKSLDSIDQEAVIRMKIYLDSVMHKYYKPIWENILKREKGSGNLTTG